MEHPDVFLKFNFIGGGEDDELSLDKLRLGCMSGVQVPYQVGSEICGSRAQRRGQLKRALGTF